MEYMSVKQASERWGLSDRRARVLCEKGKIEGVVKVGRSYLIPAHADKPVDGRTLRGRIIGQEHSGIFSRLDALKDDLDRRRPMTAGEQKRVREEFLVDFTYHSNAMEGNVLTMQETALVLEGMVVEHKPLKDHLQVVGHKDAFAYVQKLVLNKEVMSERVIKNIHSLVLIDRPNDKGVYRKIPIRVLGACCEPPEPLFVPSQMEQLMEEHGAQKRHPLESAALFHLDFEGIHPFVDGNGRTGRLLLNYMLLQNNYPPITIRLEDRKRYYDCFDSYYKEQASTPMVKFLVECMAKRLTEFLDILS
ncbi:MAG: Fic family protein [Gracilibacteraceae bacterium]|jgi:Fic family protein|nr:Fic family protein [Gracilibacteraceae bacterium]